MATGASTTDLAVVLVVRAEHPHPDPAAGYICSLLGIRSIVLAVNKIDLAAWSGVFQHIVAEYSSFVRPLNFGQVVPIDPRRRQYRREIGTCRSMMALRCSIISRPSGRADRGGCRCASVQW